MRKEDARLRTAAASRPWTKSERRVVARGFMGRFLIAIEPLVVAGFFSLLPLGMILRKREAALILAPIFGFAALAFLAYAVILILPSTRALIESFGRIYAVDGYVRYRREFRNDEPPAYFVAVLDSSKELLGEWPLSRCPPAFEKRDLWPALVEFSPYGGIHRIDGRSTGVLPESIPPLGIGAAQSFERD